MTLSNCDSNESANCEPGESEDSDGQTHPDVTSVIGPVPVHIPLKFYYRKYMLRKKNVDDEKHIDNSLVQIWKVKFGHKVKFLFRIGGQGFKVWLRF